jgi:REP element-mobilizing transposase RayT
MPRPPRIEFTGAFYHIIVRGNNKQSIFLDDQDRYKYLGLLERYKKQHGFIIYAYTLMNNHVHLLIETLSAPISKIMQVINFTYTSYFNRKHKKVGHLFQGRYKAYLCDRDAYLLALVRYIHLNPVRAKLAKNPHEYKWSSHYAYLSGNNKIVETERLLRMFSEKPSHARILYRNFLNERIVNGKDKPIYNDSGKQILGDDQFIDKVEQAVETLKKPLKRPSLKKVLSSISKVTGVTQEEIVSRNRSKRVMFARYIMVGACRELGYRLIDLQSELRRDLSVLSRWASASESKEGQRAVRMVLQGLNARLQA